MIKFVLLLLFILISIQGFAEKAFYIKDIKIECSIKNGCERYYKRLNELKDENLEISVIKEKTKVLFNEGFLDDLRLKVFELDNNQINIVIKLEPKRLIRNIFINSNIRDFNTEQIRKIFPYKTNNTLDDVKTRDSIKLIRNYLKERNIIASDILITPQYEQEKVDLKVFIKIEKLLRIKKINVNGKDKYFNRSVRRLLTKYNGKIYDAQEIKVVIDGHVNEMQNKGYYNFGIEIKEQKQGEQEIGLTLNISVGDLVVFHFNGNTVFGRADILSYMKPYIKNNLGKFTLSEIEKILIERYEDIGIYNTRIKSRFNSGINKFGRTFTNYYLDIYEGRKVPIQNLIYYGNEIWSKDKIDNLYYKNASSVAANGFLDRAYLNTFSKILRENYLKEGYVFIEVAEPKIIFSSDYLKVSVEYIIREKQQTILEAINIQNIELDLSKNIQKGLINKVGQPINVVAIQDDLQSILKGVRNAGYYFAEIVNINDNKLVHFDSSYSSATLNIDLKTGKKIILNEIIVSGNVDTKSKVVVREVDTKKGEIITPESIREIKEYLSYTGLFSTIKISPIIKERKKDTNLYYANLLIEVKERDFGVLEIAPGYRTDIGVKLATSISYNNFMGMNRSWSLKLEANQRLDVDSFDDRRRAENNKLMEYSAKIGYEEPYLFNYPVAFDIELSRTRKRYYSFDADISRISTLFTKVFSRKYTTSLRYKLEEISPFDATDIKDQEDYRIGSLTPMIALDFRNRKINPSNGAHLMLSMEYAHPALLSKKTDELEINFIKLVTRNKFYFTMGDVIVASFISLGYQRNLVNNKYYTNQNGSQTLRGYIPSREVFRLDGVDTVRGFDDTEINRLLAADDPDISEVTVGNIAYFANYKLEPRYMVDDTLMVGIFFDAGRVFVDKFEPLRVRTSAGLSLKVLTPVGTLDFDYGIKLRRKNYDDGKRDSFGRFHLSIGYF